MVIPKSRAGTSMSRRALTDSLFSLMSVFPSTTSLAPPELILSVAPLTNLLADGFVATDAANTRLKSAFSIGVTANRPETALPSLPTAVMVRPVPSTGMTPSNSPPLAFSGVPPARTSSAPLRTKPWTYALPPYETAACDRVIAPAPPADVSMRRLRTEYAGDPSVAVNIILLAPALSHDGSISSLTEVHPSVLTEKYPPVAGRSFRLLLTPSDELIP